VALPLLTHLSAAAQKGIGAHLLKVGVKRRRTKTQIDQDKEEAQLREQNATQALDQQAQLQNQLVQMEREGENNRNAANILADLMQKGLVHQDAAGNVEVPSASKKRPNNS
jgi:transposase-like protein